MLWWLRRGVAVVTKGQPRLGWGVSGLGLQVALVAVAAAAVVVAAAAAVCV